ncbi:MAG: hypothetical protein U5Q03_01745 [Bacteroidota bacterium]|nr:hypothetical protein [Bacteroidota bacterium]
MKYLYLLLIISLAACTASEKGQSGNKTKPQKPYEIMYKVNMPEELSFVNQNKKGSTIELEYVALGSENRTVRNLRLVNMKYGEGSRALQSFENIEFPFHGKLYYDSDRGPGEMEFKIFSKGYWVITLKTLTPR